MKIERLNNSALLYLDERTLQSSKTDSEQRLLISQVPSKIPSTFNLQVIAEVGSNQLLHESGQRHKTHLPNVVANAVVGRPPL